MSKMNITKTIRGKSALLFCFPFLLSFLIFFAVFHAGPSCSDAQDELVFSIETDFPPYSYESEGAHKGYLVDLARLLEVILGRKISVKFEKSAKSLEDIRNGRINGMIGAPVKKTWETSMDFSTPFSEFEYVIFTEEKNRHITSIKSLGGTLVGILEDSYITDPLEKERNITLVKTRSVPEALRKLNNHEITAVVAEKENVLFYLAKQGFGNIILAPSEAALTRPCAISVKKDDKALLDEINHALTVLEINGAFSKLSRKWLSGTVMEPFAWRKVLLMTARMMTIGILILIALWIISLRTTLKIKTQQIHDMSQRIVEREKLSILGKMAGQVAHELRSPLSIIKSNIYLMRHENAANKGLLEERLNSIDEKINLASKILESIINYATVKSSRVSEISILECLDEIMRDIEIPQNIKLDVIKDESQNLSVYMDFHQLYSILRNLIVNALQAMGDGGSLTVNIFFSDSGKKLNMRISDTGKGVPEAVRGRIFSIFYSTKTTGSGLGLPIARSLAETNGGKLVLEKTSNEGTSFLLTLPSAKSINKGQ